MTRQIFRMVPRALWLHKHKAAKSTDRSLGDTFLPSCDPQCARVRCASGCSFAHELDSNPSQVWWNSGASRWRCSLCCRSATCMRATLPASRVHRLRKLKSRCRTDRTGMQPIKRTTSTARFARLSPSAARWFCRHCRHFCRLQVQPTYLIGIGSRIDATALSTRYFPREHLPSSDKTV
jgi:hypothetical protein